VRDEVDVTPSSGRQPAFDGTGTIALSLLQWQADGDAAVLEALLRGILPLLERLASRTLRRHGIADCSAVDDAISLVIDHLRRLHGTAADERTVARFRPSCPQQHRREPVDTANAGDTGLAYVSWLIRDRAADVARTRRREAQHAIPFSLLGNIEQRIINKRAEHWSDSVAGIGSAAEEAAAVREAIAMLEPRLRTVIELLLDGKSQAAIAMTLHVCEGTVSRMRGRAIMELRRLLGT
jgi:DNA-directed RNA polymerase specialized sigma24 family protein